MKQFVFVSIWLALSNMALAQTMRVVNGSNEPVVFSLVSGADTTHQRLEPREYHNFELRETEDDRVLIVRTASRSKNALFEEGTRVLHTKVVRASSAPTKLIIAFLHQTDSRKVLDFFCLGKGTFLPLQFDPQAAEDAKEIGQKFSRGDFTMRWEVPRRY